MEQKYIKASYNLDGKINLDKKMIGNIIDLVRISPTSARVFLLLCAYASRNNTVITDVASIARLLGEEELNIIKSALNNLRKNSYLDFSTIAVKKDFDIKKVIHDRKLYNETNFEKWEVVDTRLATNFKIDGEFNLITINDQFAVADENEKDGSNLILHIKGRLFLDSNITKDELDAFIYPDIH